MTSCVASAPGKVNLLLRCGPAGEDGYHPLLTVFEAVSVREWVHAQRREDGNVTVRNRVYLPGVASDPVFAPELTESLEQMPAAEHLAVRAAEMLRSHRQVAAGADLTVHKTVPVAAGMAGGSADAAAALVALNELWQLGCTQDELLALGRLLGADVPACLLGMWSLGTGRGDHLRRIDVPGLQRQHWWTFGFSHERLSTPQVFATFDRLGAGDSQALPDSLSWDANRGLLPAGPTPVLVNDLEYAATSMDPSIHKTGAVAMSAGAAAWVVSGSGPTVAALSFSRRQAEKVASAWLQGAPVRSVAVATGPSDGAKIEEKLPPWAIAGSGQGAQ